MQEAVKQFARLQVRIGCSRRGFTNRLAITCLRRPSYSGFVLAVWMTICRGCLNPQFSGKSTPGKAASLALAINPPTSMLPSYQRSIQGVGILLVMFSLGACGGLPKVGERPSSTALKNNGGTVLAAVVRPRVAAHPGQSGLHTLLDGREALAARLALADAAQRSLDVQYFIWNKDMSGKVLLEHLFRAADRGVRVRLLLDDLGTMPSDA